jgi:hypothetical protein
MTADERRTGPPTGHADLDTLADLQAGGLEGPEAEHVRGHVAGCRDCAAVLEALDAVQEQLRSLPRPAMPAAVAARLDATLDDLRTGGSEPAAPAGRDRDREDELALARARRGRRVARSIGAAAAVVVVIAAGGAIASIVRTSTSEVSSSSGGAGSAPAQPHQESGGPVPKSVDSDSGGEAALPAYDRASLRAALPTIAARGAAPRTVAMDPVRLATCADGIPGATGSLRGVQGIVYQGRPAYVFVYANGDRLTGFVVTATCGGAPDQPTAVLDTVS